MVRRPPSATRLSHPKSVGSRRSRRNPRLAQLSLLLGVVALVSSACIVSDPAEYGVAKQSPPFLNANTASPSVLYRQDLDLGKPFKVNVRVRSEDVGDALVAQLFVDKGAVGEAPLGVRDLPPGKLDEARTIDISGENLTGGCHAVSLVVTHRSNLTNANDPFSKPRSDDDTAILTWWVNVDDAGQNLMSECPAKGGAN